MTGDLEIDAGEYVLGTLDLSERTAFAERLRGDSLARAAVAAWERRLADLAAAIVPVTPPALAWVAIERAIQPEAKLHPFKVISGGGKVASVSASLLASRNRWRLGALASGAVAAVLAVFVADRTIRDTGAPESLTYVAAVNRGGDQPALLVRVDLKTRQVFIRPVAAEAPAGKSLELWYIGKGEAPRSMGVLDKVPETLPLPKDGKADATVFAVSLEPAGGSKTGAPTGPVLYSGQLIKE